jgi:hypothetical protein
MSKHQRDTENGQLPLPSPRSPRELDQRILAHARARAPAKQLTHTASWVGGMATTAVLFVAIYLTNSSDTELVPMTPPVLTEQRSATGGLATGGSATGAAAPAARKARATAEISADFDALEAAPTAKEEVQMAPAANARFQAMKRLDDTAPDLQASLQHLQQLLANGQQDRALLEYQELRNTCRDCGLPEALEEALQLLQ